MRSNEKFSIAQAIAKAVIDTLTRMDYVNVVCARASYWDQIGKLGVWICNSLIFMVACVFVEVVTDGIVM